MGFGPGFLWKSRAWRMKRRWLLIGLVVAANVLAALVFALYEPMGGPETWTYYALAGMQPSHGSLLGFWAALGGKATPWRLVVAVVGVTAWVSVLEKFDAGHGDDAAIWGTVLLMQMGLVSVLLMVARFLGVELTDTLASEPAQTSEPAGQWVQFTLRALLSWTTALALLLGSLHYLPKPPLREIADNIAVLAAILCGGALIALGAIWITLGARWAPARYVVLGLSGGVGIGLMYAVLGPGETLVLSVFCVAETVWLVGSLWLVRLAGYRLVWRRRVRL